MQNNMPNNRCCNNKLFNCVNIIDKLLADIKKENYNDNGNGDNYNDILLEIDLLKNDLNSKKCNEQLLVLRSKFETLKDCINSHQRLIEYLSETTQSTSIFLTNELKTYLFDVMENLKRNVNNISNIENCKIKFNNVSNNIMKNINEKLKSIYVIEFSKIIDRIDTIFKTKNISIDFSDYLKKRKEEINNYVNNIRQLDNIDYQEYKLYADKLNNELDRELNNEKKLSISKNECINKLELLENKINEQYKKMMDILNGQNGILKQKYLIDKLKSMVLSLQTIQTTGKNIKSNIIELKNYVNDNIWGKYINEINDIKEDLKKSKKIDEIENCSDLLIDLEKEYSNFITKIYACDKIINDIKQYVENDISDDIEKNLYLEQINEIQKKLDKNCFDELFPIIDLLIKEYDADFLNLADNNVDLLKQKCINSFDLLLNKLKNIKEEIKIYIDDGEFIKYINEQNSILNEMKENVKNENNKDTFVDCVNGLVNLEIEIDEKYEDHKNSMANKDFKGGYRYYKKKYLNLKEKLFIL